MVIRYRTPTEVYTTIGVLSQNKDMYKAESVLGITEWHLTHTGRYI